MNDAISLRVIGELPILSDSPALCFEAPRDAARPLPLLPTGSTRVGVMPLAIRARTAAARSGASMVAGPASEDFMLWYWKVGIGGSRDGSGSGLAHVRVLRGAEHVVHGRQTARRLKQTVRAHRAV
ncbi:MAG: hypothetical protein ACFHWZ_17485 [Phycisphaerales bacterium]